MPYQSTTLVWFKRDLRLADHAPLAFAAARGPVVALYIYEPIITHAAIFDASHLVFLNQCLAELGTALEAIGVPLTLRRGDAVGVLDALRRETSFETLASHEETGNGATYARDLAVKCWCEANQVAWHEWPQHGVIRRLKSRNGWAKRWDARMSSALVEPPQYASALHVPLSTGVLESRAFGLPTSDKRIQLGGRNAGLRLLESFLETRSHNYQREMSSPSSAWTSCSRLSAHLALGTLSLREVAQLCACKQMELRERKNEGEPLPASWQRSLQSFQGRLHWHCHFMQKLEDEPQIEFENFSRSFDGLRPLENDSDFNHDAYAAWCEARTGYPMVDACMRALLETGWINFRMRAMLVSFASYQLWLDWRPVARHLAKHFLDFEPGIHYSQIQMQSGTTGINTPRMYSPIKQAIDQDPTGAFIKRYLPMLGNIPPQLLAEPHLLSRSEQAEYRCRIGQDYPAPIVDHKISFRLARERYGAFRNSPAARREADEVQAKHGSRKSGLKQMRQTGERRTKKSAAKRAVPASTQLSLLEFDETA
jgi:deoxyribodipyrimidine photo-lyase